MKLIKLFPVLLLFASCSKDELLATQNCNCEKTFYNYTAAMYGPNQMLLVPEKYTFVSMQSGVCGTTSNGYVVETGSNYNRSKTNCK